MCSGIWSVATTWSGFWPWIWSMRDCSGAVACWFQCWKNCFHLASLITLVILMSKWLGLFLRKNHLLRCWSWLSLLNWIGALTLSVAKSASKEIGALICFMEFLSPEVALYLYKFTIQPCIKYCCHVWAGAPSC